MIVLTNKLGLVNISHHAKERMVERYGIRKSSLRKMFKRIIEKGRYIDRGSSCRIKYGHYTLVAKNVSGYWKIITAMNTTKVNNYKYEWYHKGEKHVKRRK